MSKLSKEYLSKVINLIESIKHEEENAINNAAILMANSIINGNKIFGFGCTHYSLHLQDIIYRAGGLMLINPILIPGISSLDTHPLSMTSAISRLEGYAEIVFNNFPINNNDVLIIVSVTGRNGIEVEMAKLAKERNVKVIGITSKKYSGELGSRHSSGKKMLDFLDVIIDDKVGVGDAIIACPQLKEKISAVSGITNIAILHAIEAACIEELVDRDIKPPIYISGHIKGGNAHNIELREKFKDQILY